MSSILTNNGAMVALQTLKSINSNLLDTQNMISTGKEIATAKDNSSVWAISKVMESDKMGFEAISASLDLGESTLAVASTAAETITDLLTEVKAKVVAAQEENVDRGKIQTDITALTDQIQSVVDAAQFNGLNMISSASADVDILSSLDRDNAGAVTSSSITVKAHDLDTTSGLSDLGNIDVTSTASAVTSLDLMEDLINTAINAAADFGSARGRIEIQAEFLSNLTDAFTSGIGSLVDADMEEASAKLQALQVQQQLGVQALSIANQAPQSILSLFR